MRKIILLFTTFSAVFAGEVTPNGSYSHTVEIQVPPGTNGMQPKLALSYNSGGGNGMMGVGWGLQGAPSITRINNGNGINYSGADTYAGQGGKLVDVSGGRTLFHTENESFSRYVPVYNGGCVPVAFEPCSWVVTDSSGMVMEYGTTSDTRTPGKNGAIRAWYLRKVTDLHGNFYTIEYIQDSGESYPYRIVYTQNNQGGINRYRSVEFEYDNSRTDQKESNVAGYPVTIRYRIVNIRVRTGILNILGINIPLTGDLVRRYHLNYGIGTTGRSLLVSVQEFGSDDTSTLPPQIFTYQIGDLNGSFEPQQCTPNVGVGTASPFTQNTFVGDFNGDGKSDITSFNGTTGWCVQHGNGSTFNGQQCNPSGVGSAAPITTNSFAGDFDGDGKTDIASFASGQTWCVQHGNGTSFDNQQCMPNNGVGSSAPIASNALLGDFNGDGRTDIAAYVGTGTTWCVQHGNATTFDPQLCQPNGIGTAPSISENTFVADFNGDGKADIASFAGGQTWCVQHGNTHSFDPQQCMPGNNGVGSSAPITKNAIVGDFNGDGLMDIAAYVGTGTAWCVQHGNATSFDPQLCQPNGVGTAPSISENTIVGDFDGDGRTDVASNNGGTGWCVQHGNTHSFDVQQCMPVPGVGTAAPIGQNTLVGDFNGDGRTDIASYGGTTVWCVQHGNATTFDGQQCTGSGVGTAAPVATYTRTSDVNADNKGDLIAYAGGQTWCVAKGAGNNRFDMMASLTTTQGGTIYINYDFATQLPNTILPQNSSYPSISNKSGNQIVTAMTTVDGRGGSYVQFFQYYNAKTYSGTADQRKQLGFEWVKTIRPDGSYGYTYFNQSPDIAGTPAREQQYDPNGQLTSDIINTVTTMNPYPGTKITLVPQKRMIAYEGGVVVFDSTTDTQYDGYGFATVRATTTAGFTLQVESLVYQHDVAANVYGRITEKVLYSGSLGGTKLNHERTIYNGSGATCAQPNQITLICEKQVWLDKDKNGPQNRFISTFYMHNIYGSLTSTTDALGHASTFQFETDYQTFPTLITNAKGYRTAYAYDPRYGHKLTISDIENNVTASTEYDVFGRKVREKNVNGEVTQETIFANSGDPNNQYTETRTMDQSSDGYQWSRAYVDGLGRTYKKTSEGYGAGGANLQTDITYDGTGRKWSETNAYLNPGGTPLVTNYVYQSDGKLLTIIFPEDRNDGTGKVTKNYVHGTTTISGLTVSFTTVTDAKGNSKTTYKDSQRRTLRVDEAGATMRHNYDELGRLIQTIDADGYITTIEYDSLGRKIRMTEPNSGQLVYRYDDVGNLVEQVDGKGQAILFTYDILNRLTLKNLPGNETDVTYEYDSSSSTFGIGRLSKVVDAAGIIEYNYDNRGNMSAWKRTIDNYSFSFQATYDIQNRTEQLTYPDGYKARNYYSDQGNLRQVRMLSPSGFFGSSLVTYQGPETTGTTELIRKLGNGVISKIGYDEATQKPTYLKTYLKNDITFASPVQYLSYDYDDVGNLEEITDGINANRSESFTFDNMYRLIQAQSAMYGTKNYSFTAGGNMLQNGNLQLYYGNDVNCTNSALRPVHGVCADSQGHQYGYDGNGNMTSREGRTLEYDSLDRLTAIKENGIAKLSFVYNHAGERVKKIRTDGAVTYSIGGVYEVQKKPDGSEVHTKYFTGIKGDRIAQETKSSSQITLAQVTTTSTEIYLASGRGSFMAALYSAGNTAGYLMVRFSSAALTDRGTGHVTIFLLVIIGGMGFLVIRSRGANTFAYWQRLVATPTLVCFLSVMFLNCSGNSVANNGTTWTTETGSTAGVPTLNTPHSTYNDATLAGMPVTGTFFLVPNHLGSTTLVTDASGNSVISEFHYEPYGDVITAYSTGPDIVRNTYSGQVRDAESSLSYYGSRYFDTRLGRFISADTVVPDASDSQGYNRYMYVRGNPIDFVDPGGHGWFSSLCKAIVAAVAVAVVAAIAISSVVSYGAAQLGVVAGIGAGVRGGVTDDYSIGNLALGAGQALLAFGAAAIGIATGGAAFAAYGGAAGGFTAATASGFFGGMAGGFVGGAGNAWVEGKNFWDGLEAGLVGAIIGAASGFALSAITYGAQAGWQAFKEARAAGTGTRAAQAASNAADDAAGAVDNAVDLSQPIGAKAPRVSSADADRLAEIHSTSKSLARDVEGKLRTVDNFGSLRSARTQVASMQRLAGQLETTSFSKGLARQLNSVARILNAARQFPPQSSFYSDAIDKAVNRLDAIATKTADYGRPIQFNF